MNLLRKRLGLLACLILACALRAQTPTVSITGPAGMQKAGTAVQLAVNISATGATGDQAIQFTLANVSWPITATNGSAITGIGKAVSCSQVGTNFNCVVDGGASPLADGQLAVLSVQIPKSAPGATVPFAVSNLLAANTDASGAANPAPLVAGSPFSLNITSACDINGDGVVNAADQTLINSQINKASACTSDLNSSGACDIVDGQIVANAIAGGKCAAQ